MSYIDSLRSLAESAITEAVIAQMTCDGYDWDGHLFSAGTNYGEASDSRAVTLDGVATGHSYLNGAGGEDPDQAAWALNDLNAAKTKWETNINELIDGWDQINLPSAWDEPEHQLQMATKQVSVGSGGQHSDLGNADLTEIGFIRDRLPTNIGITVDAFYRTYGPDKLELVLDGHCEAMACLGMAITGERKLWEDTQTDVLAILEAAVTAFEETRHEHSTEWGTSLNVVTAAFGLIAAFTAGIPGAAPFFGAMGAATSFLGTALSAVEASSTPRTIPEDGGYYGSHPDHVFEDLVTAFKALNQTISDVEDGLEAMLDSFTSAIGTPANRPNFHIHPVRGLEPSFAEHDDIIDLKYSILESIGYESMPLIARAFLTSVDYAEAGDQQAVWGRPYATKLGTSIGSSAYGPYYAWRQLLYAIYPLANDTAAEIVSAGAKLAEAAGFIRDSDSGVRRRLGSNYRDLHGARLGWQQAPVDPVPAPRPGSGQYVSPGY